MTDIGELKLSGGANIEVFSPAQFLEEVRRSYNAGLTIRGYPPEIPFAREQAQTFVEQPESETLFEGELAKEEVKISIVRGFTPIKNEYDHHFVNLFGYLGKLSVGSGTAGTILNMGEDMQPLLRFVYTDALGTYALVKGLSRNGKNLSELITYLRASPADIREEVVRRPPGSSVTVRPNAGSSMSNLVITRVVGAPVRNTT